METYVHNTNINYEKKLAYNQYSSAFTFSAPPATYSTQKSLGASPYLTGRFEKASPNGWISNKKIQHLYQPWKTRAIDSKSAAKLVPPQEQLKPASSKYEKELSQMAHEIHKIRVLLAEQLSHSHGFNNLTEAKRILNKKIQKYQELY